MEDSDEEAVEEEGREEVSHHRCRKQRMEMKADEEVPHHCKQTVQQDDLPEVSFVSKLPKTSHHADVEGPCSSKWGVATTYE